ncbi:MAG TPA: DUF4382 domain-containing protein [Gemmatimonadales bacterium]|nr:DUF4382 domain-containing protein [Gemmatimonadales bacterium]
MLPLITRRLIGSMGALALATLAACSEGTGPGSAEVTVVLRRGGTNPTLSETGSGAGARTLTADVAALSCPFQAAGVTINEIYLQGEGGRVTLRSNPVQVELCDLGSQSLVLLQGVEVPAGRYQQIRFVIGGGYVQDGDGNVYATPGYQLPPELAPADGVLQTPSWDASGLKVDFEDGPVTLESGQQVIALDFDVAQSFGQLAGGSGQWVMSPIIKAADISFTGSVRVRLELAEGVTLPEVNGTAVTFADFEANAAGGPVPLTQAFDPTTGETRFFLSPMTGPYTITLVPPGTLNVTAQPASHAVTIIEGVAAPPVTFTLTAVTVP